MNKKIKLTLLAIVLVITALVLTGCGGGPTAPDLMEGFERFEGENFEIQYPEEWTVEIQTIPGAEAVMFTDIMTGSNVVVAVERLGGRIGLSGTKDLAVDTLVAQGANRSDIREESVRVNGMRAYRLETTIDMMGIEVEIISIVTGRRRVAATITLSTLDISENVEVFNELIETFTPR